LQRSSSASPGDAEPGCAERRSLRHHPFSFGFSAFSIVCPALGQDLDDDAWPPRSAGPASPLSRISDDAAGVYLGRSRAPVPWASWQGTVHHGLPTDLYLPGRGDGGYLAFIGRISPEKGVEKAIKIARRAGIPLKIAAKVDKADLDYYNAKIKRLLKGPGVEFIGEIGNHDKGEFLGRAMALLFPIDWPEPFGLVMIEAMANGTPVVAFRRGSVPEIIDDGLTGFIVDSVDRAVAAVPRAAALDRSGIRRCFEEQFSVERMARDYIELYDDVLRRSSIDAVVLSTRAAGQREAA